MKTRPKSWFPHRDFDIFNLTIPVRTIKTRNGLSGKAWWRNIW